MASESHPASSLIRLGDEKIALEDLLDLARDGSLSSRNRLVESLGELYFDDSAGVGAGERELMAQILHQLVRDVEIIVRKRLAERFGSEADAPAALLDILANDHAEVAHPILKNSPVLDDAELINIIGRRTMRHRTAIAMRETVSEPVSDALVEKSEPTVIEALICNQGARLSAETMSALVEASKDIECYRAPLLDRQDLTPRLARQMYWWVSAALRKHIAANFDIDSTELDSKIVETVREMIGEQAARELPADGLDELARKLALRGQITSELLIETLRQHQSSLFEALFAQLIGLKKSLVRRFIFQSGGESLAIACKAASIYKHDFTTIFLLSRSARPGEKLVDPGELTRAVEFYDKITPETAKKVVERWHLDPDYLDALKKLGSGARPG